MPRRRFDALELALADGERVLVEGKAEIYAAKGALSFRAATIERVGLGDHLAAIERLKRVLAAEGLFAAERKRPLPRFPRAVGVVTGADAAARGDVLTGHPVALPGSSHRRSPRRACRVRAPRRRSPPRSRRVAAHPAVDVVIVARGGGSFEDLLPFSDEVVVRAFAACPVPVVSAVGHEQDTPLCDLAADVRASTPTAAARLVVPDLAELQAALGRQRDLLDSSVRRSLVRERERLEPQPRPTPGAPAAPARAPARRRSTTPLHDSRRSRHVRHSTRGYAIVRSGGIALRDAAAVAPGERARDRARGRRPDGTVGGGADE